MGRTAKKPPSLAIVGVGLIGGSVALAARARGLTQHVVGIDCDPDCLKRARSLGIIDKASGDLAAVAGCDMVVFCTPVDVIARQVLEAAPLCATGALLTDTGSTKEQIVREVDEGLPAGVAFAGSHPLAGSEKQGPEHADRDLFQGRMVVVTPTERSTESGAMGRAAVFWSQLGARPRLMHPDQHDRAVALTSHLPHLVASALAGMPHPQLYDMTASGFRDTTRLAAASPALWTAICQQNRANLIDALDALVERLEAFRQGLEDDNYDLVAELLAQGWKVKQDLARQPV